MPRLRGRWIAVGVADEPLRETIRRTLEREGARVTTHPTGLSIRGAVAASTPDCCIVDVDLPDLGGEDLVREIRRGKADLPVILVSAYLFSEEGGKLGGLPVLPLPFRRPQLLELLEKILGPGAAA